MRRALSILVTTTFTFGCTAHDTIGPRMALFRSTTEDTIRVPTKDGGTVEFGPNATLHIAATRDVELSASDLYVNDWGLFEKNGNAIGSWDDVEVVNVEQTDGLATVAATATVAIIVIGLAVIAKNASAPSGSKSSSSSSSPSSGGGKSVRSAPNAPTSGSGANYDSNGAGEILFRTGEAIVNTVVQNQVASEEDETLGATMPLFASAARRRASVRFIARLEGGACWPTSSSQECFLSGGRGGLRIYDLFEVTGGVRVESASTTSRPLATFGAMLHGELPSAHWFALALGASVAFEKSFAHIIPTLSLRFRPTRGLWVGLVPIQPVYATETGSWTMASGVEITGEL